MSKILKDITESIMDNDIAVGKKIENSIDDMIREWLFSTKHFVTVSGGKRVMERITYDDFEIKNHIIYVKPELSLIMYDIDDIPPYITFGYINHDIHIFECKCKNMSKLFKLDQQALKDLRYITIENCPNLMSLPDIKNLKNCFILKIAKCPKLHIDYKDLPTVDIAITLYGNKNKVNYDDIRYSVVYSDRTDIILSKEEEEINKQK